MTQLVEQLWLGDRFSSREELEEQVSFWDASTAGLYAACPRKGYYADYLGIVPVGEILPLAAGSAIHAAMAVLYTTGEPDLALEVLRHEFGEGRDSPPPSSKWSHLHLGHLEVVFKNYVDWASKHDTFEPLVVRLDDINTDQLAAAIWQVTEDGRVVLGESKLVMRFEVDGEEFFYAGRPDLPIIMGGRIYLMDHKSTSAYLSEWYFAQHRLSNQLRGYCKMIEVLTGERVAGTLINGIYVGEKATLPSSKTKTVKFSRFGPTTFHPSHYDEAIRNQYYWQVLRDVYKELNYWPQHTGRLCSGCSYADLCATKPRSRPATMRRDFVKSRTEFLDL